MTAANKIAISTPNAPAAIGPYSQAIRIGKTLYASGQIALDPVTSQLVPGGVPEQTVQVFENILSIDKAIIPLKGYEGYRFRS